MEEARRLFWFVVTLYLFVSLLVYALHAVDEPNKFGNFREHWKEIIGEAATRIAFIIAIYISGDEFIQLL